VKDKYSYVWKYPPVFIPLSWTGPISDSTWRSVYCKAQKKKLELVKSDGRKTIMVGV